MSKKAPSKKVRKISAFLCQEMMYDYVSDNLDADRRLAMDEFIISHADAKKEMHGTKEAMDYCQGLSRTKLSQPLYQEISEYKSFWGQFGDRFAWSNWPEYMRWATEALVFSTIIGVFALMVPWDLVGRWVFPEQPTVALIEKTVDQTQGDEKKPEKKQKSLPTINKSEKTPSLPLVIAKSEDKSEKDKNSLNESIAQKLAASEKKNEQKQLDKKEDVRASLEKKKPTLKGELYRSYMNVKDVEGVTAKVVELIRALEGKKAGKVQLGWPKPNSSYFHFALPEKNYDELVKKLNDYGRLKIYKYPHGRMMPEGQRRIILEIKRIVPDHGDSSGEETIDDSSVKDTTETKVQSSSVNSSPNNSPSAAQSGSPSKVETSASKPSTENKKTQEIQGDTVNQMGGDSEE